MATEDEEKQTTAATTTEKAAPSKPVSKLKDVDDDGEENASAADDERDTGDEREAADEAGGEAGELAEDDASGEDEDLPKNRAERRAAAKREKRGVVLQKKPSEREAKPRVKPPPITVTGKSSADEVPPWMRKAGDWITANRNAFVGTSLAILLASVVESAGAPGKKPKMPRPPTSTRKRWSSPTRSSDPQTLQPNRPLHHPDGGQPSRTEPHGRGALLEACRKVTQGYSGAPVYNLARLCEAGALYDLGRYDEARPIYESLIGSDVGGQEARVLEGLAFTLEAAGKVDDAARRFEELGRLQDSAFRDLAVFHQARLLAKKDQTARAKELLHGLLERLNRTASAAGGANAESAGANTLAEGESPSLLTEEARALLHDLDPADPLGVRKEDPQAMLRRLLQQRQGGGARNELEE